MFDNERKKLKTVYGVILMNYGYISLFLSSCFCASLVLLLHLPAEVIA